MSLSILYEMAVSHALAGIGPLSAMSSFRYLRSSSQFLPLVLSVPLPRIDLRGGSSRQPLVVSCRPSLQLVCLVVGLMISHLWEPAGTIPKSPSPNSTGSPVSLPWMVHGVTSTRPWIIWKYSGSSVYIVHTEGGQLQKAQLDSFFSTSAILLSPSLIFWIGSAAMASPRGARTCWRLKPEKVLPRAAPCGHAELVALARPEVGRDVGGVKAELAARPTTRSPH
mmetsp:Transcript_44395/g.108501  ORF Transcript_44395/g.108501 Transcript_44395/m.108501 type:complete len:224 (+) Transcript_44395:351-1022(+)